MRSKILLILLAAFLFTGKALAQCVTGQTPGSAFPVCGTTPFVQTQVPTGCAVHTIFTPCKDGVTYQDLNPFWYKFTCYTAGAFRFTITPVNSGDDYDWQLFDITNHQPTDVYSDPTLFVVGNWAGTYGVTGTAPSLTDTIECASNPSDGVSTFSKMPNLILGHNYLLLISHFSGNDQSGYTLSFGGTGNTASITDPTNPQLLSADAACDGMHVRVVTNKKMRCSTLAADGSDFSITPSIANIISASGNNCSNGFDMDTITLTLDKQLSPGNYTIAAKVGSDTNTLLDNCDRNVPVGDQQTITVYPFIPTPMDSITPVVNCNPDTVQLVFKQAMLCNSVAPNGSDFVISGPSAVTVSSAQGVACSGNSTTYTIQVIFSTPVFTGGTYQIKLVRGTDGNTLLDECGLETPVNSTLNFTVKQAVSAAFSFTVSYGCKYDTIYYSHNGQNNVNQWSWVFDNSQTSTLQSPALIYNTFTPKLASLHVSNGICTDSSSVAIVLLNDSLKAAFTGPSIACPADTVSFKDASIGHILSWNWDFSNGNTSFVQNPPVQAYPITNSARNYPVRLVVVNAVNCYDTTYRIITVVANCYIAVPSAFTPNGDGLNDYLYPLNAYKAINLEFRVFNRYGQLLFETKDWTKKWDGTYKSNPQPSGAYVWMLDYTDPDTGKRISEKGTTVLIR